jgi:hypothetical protein
MRPLMSATTPRPQIPEFFHRSSEESICLACFLTVRPRDGQNLEAAEAWHQKECARRLLSERGSPGETFTHRTVRPGVIDVLCLRCLALLGTAATPVAIKALQTAHRCKT